VLGNGLRVVVVENHAEPLADVAIWYRFGSADDPPGRLGVAHALEHMMFRGTHALSGTGLDRAGARFGSDANAETDLDYTHYFQTVPVGAVPFAMHVEADRMRGLLLGARDWRLEREAVLTEIADDDWLDRGRTEDAIRGRAFGGTAFAHDPGGTARDVRRIGVADLRRAYDKAYRPQNAMLVVTGDVDPSSIVDLARRLFGPIRGGRRFRHASAEPVVARGFVERLRGANSDLVDVALESRGLDANDESAEELALELIMPGHAVLRRLLVNEGPCDSYDVDDDSQAHGGLIHVLCVPDAGHTVDTALRGVRHALRELPSRVTPADIAYARRRDILETTYSCDSLRDEADLFGQTYALVGKDPRTIDRATARVSDAAVIAVLRRWSTPVAAAIARGARDTEMVHAGRHVRVEHVAPAPLDADVEPAWARSVPTLRPARLDPLETFALPNGVRVFFQPRPGNGTVYLRGSLERHTAQSYPRSATWRTAERHAIVMDGDSPSGMHGVSRDLPVMLSFLAAMWRVHEPMPRPPARRTFPWPQEAWIAMTGDVDPSVVRADVARVFGAWHRPVPPNAPSPAPTPFPAREISFGARGPSVRGALLFPAPKRGSPESATMEMLVGVLGDGSASDARLMREIRTRRGLVYGIGTLYDPDHGIFFVWYESTQAHFAAAHTAVRDVLDAVRAGAISTQERDRAYDDLVADALRDESSPDGIIDLLGQAAKEHRTPDDPQSLAARYAVVSRDDLRRLAARELRFEHVIDFDEGRGR
jgi:predicted Zn-dependent peptidase